MWCAERQARTTCRPSHGCVRVCRRPGTFPHEEIRSPDSLRWAYRLVWEYLSLFWACCVFFVLLKCVCHMAPDQSHCYPCSWPGGKVVLLRSTRGVRADHLPAMAAGQDFLTTGDQDSLLKQILLSLFHESKAWLLPVPLRLGFFLVSPTPASHAVGGRPGTAAPGGRQQLPLSQHVVQGKGRRVQDGSRFLAEQLETGVIIN